jgi:hypothetical protein
LGAASAGAADLAALERFLAAGQVDLDAWRDGTGYPLDMLRELNAATRELIPGRLAVRGWREVEVLAALDTPAARSALRRAFDAASPDNPEIGLALLRTMPELLTEDERTRVVCQAVAQARGGNGLDAALQAAQAWHPAPVVQALWQALQQPDAVVVVNVAALLHFLHGLADEPFDMDQRSEFLRFADDDPAERAAARERLKSRLVGG